MFGFEMNWEKHTKVLQLAGAALAIPAAFAGAYSAYRTYFSTEQACNHLRAEIIATMERNVTADAKRALLRKDVAEFEKKCGEVDPDARVIFQAAVAEQRPAQAAGASPSSNPQPAQPTTGVPSGAAAAVISVPSDSRFGLSPSGERRGWVLLDRRDAARNTELYFEGTSATFLPAVDSVLTARRMVPVWREILPGPADDAKLQGRLKVGSCVRVLATRPVSNRRWAEVAPVRCP
jgi:hypothetical protein